MVKNKMEAVAQLFGKKLYEEYGVNIKIIEKDIPPYTAELLSEQCT